MHKMMIILYCEDRHKYIKKVKISYHLLGENYLSLGKYEAASY